MATTKEKQLAREWALREITELISMAQNGRTLTFAHRANPYADDKTRRLVDKEISSLWWQLVSRHERLKLQLGLS